MRTAALAAEASAALPPTRTAPAVPTGTLRGYIPTLDGWRAIAVLLVVFDHVKKHGICAVGSTAPLCTVEAAGHGVAIFFGLSGFLITLRMMEEREVRGRLSLRGFFVRRAFRILPPALAYLGIVGVLALTVGLEVGAREWLASVFFIRASR